MQCSFKSRIRIQLPFLKQGRIKCGTKTVSKAGLWSKADINLRRQTSLVKITIASVRKLHQLVKVAKNIISYLLKKISGILIKKVTLIFPSSSYHWQEVYSLGEVLAYNFVFAAGIQTVLEYECGENLDVSCP